MFDFFQNIADFFSKIWDFLVFVWQQITQFFRMLSPALKFFQQLISSLHPLLLTFGIAMLVVLILYVVLGRSAGGD